MIDWVLIILIASRSTDAGMAATSVRFRSESSCMSAAKSLVDEWNSKDMGWPKIVVACTKDHP